MLSVKAKVLYILLKVKAKLRPILFTPTRCHAAFGSNQSQPLLLDWTRWLEGNSNDLLSQVLTRCWQTPLCGTEQGWWPKWTELTGLLLLSWAKMWAAHGTDAPQWQMFLWSTVCAVLWHHLYFAQVCHEDSDVLLLLHSTLNLFFTAAVPTCEPPVPSKRDKK